MILDNSPSSPLCAAKWIGAFTEQKVRKEAFLLLLMQTTNKNENNKQQQVTSNKQQATNKQTNKQTIWLPTNAFSQRTHKIFANNLIDDSSKYILGMFLDRMSQNVFLSTIKVLLAKIGYNTYLWICGFCKI